MQTSTRWKEIGAQFLNIAAVVVFPYIFLKLGIIKHLSGGAFMILALTAVMMWFRIQVQQSVTGKHEYHGDGVGYCLLTLGGLLPVLALQLSTAEDLFPGVPMLPAHLLPAFMSEEVSAQRTGSLFLMFWLTIAFTWFTAKNAEAIRAKTSVFPAGLALLNFTFGQVFLAMFIFLLIGRA